jgi:hypothetical protein
LSKICDGDALHFIIHKESRFAKNALRRVVGITKQTLEGVGFTRVALVNFEIIIESAHIAL